MKDAGNEQVESVGQQNRWKRDTEKESYWRDRLALWQKSGLSVQAFCKKRGIVETSFYAWCRELIIRARELGELEIGDMSVAAMRNSVKDGRGRRIPVRFRQTDAAPLQSLPEASLPDNPFVPLRIVPEKQNSVEQAAALGRSDLKVVTPQDIRLSYHRQSMSSFYRGFWQYWSKEANARSLNPSSLI